MIKNGLTSLINIKNMRYIYWLNKSIKLYLKVSMNDKKNIFLNGGSFKIYCKIEIIIMCNNNLQLKSHNKINQKCEYS